MISYSSFRDEFVKIAAANDWKRWDPDKGRIYDPAVTAHEAGHIELHRKSPLVTAARVGGGLVAGLGPTAYALTQLVRKKELKLAPMAAMIGGGFVPILADEAYASIKGYKSLKESKRYTPKELKNMRDKLLAAGGTYASVPLGALSVLGTAAAIDMINERRLVRGRKPVHSIVPQLIAGVGVPIASALATRAMMKKLKEGKGPAVSKQEAKRVAKAIVPDVDVYATDVPIPQGSFAVPKQSKAQQKQTEELLKPLLRSKTDRRNLATKGGIMIAPIRDNPRGGRV